MARLHKFISLFLCFTFATLLAGCNDGGGGSSTNNPGSNGAITGNVQGNTSAGRVVLAQATVTAVASNASGTNFTTQTDANGDYLLSNLPPGTYHLGFSATGYVAVAPTSGSAVIATVTGGNVVTAATILLQPASGVGVAGDGSNGLVPEGFSGLVVTVTEAGTNTPVTDATVSAAGISTGQGSGGVYSLLIQLANGTNPQAATVTVQSPRHETQSVAVTLQSAKSIPVTVQLAKRSGNGNGSGNGGSAVAQVTVADAATGRPISSAAVSDGSSSVNANSQGVASLTVSAANGSVQITASAAGYASQTVAVNVTAGQTTTATVRLNPEPVTLNGVIQIAGGGTSGLSTVSISVGGLSATFTNPRIDTSTGNFTLTLPANSGSRSVTYTLTFTSPQFNLAVVTGVRPPASGPFSLEKPVVLTRIGGTGNGNGNGNGNGTGNGNANGVTVFGSVLTFGGNIPLGGAATIVELGITAPVNAGRFGFIRVPVNQAFTLSVQVRGPLGDLQAALVPFIVPSANASTYVLPTIFTR